MNFVVKHLESYENSSPEYFAGPGLTLLIAYQLDLSFEFLPDKIIGDLFIFETLKEE